MVHIIKSSKLLDIIEDNSPLLRKRGLIGVFYLSSKELRLEVFQLLSYLFVLFGFWIQLLQLGVELLE